jgi:RNAse (barnase) inhibitor barstar
MSKDDMDSFEQQSILYLTHERSLAIVDLLLGKGDVLFPLDGAKIASKDELLSQFAQAMEFPIYFSNNWDALEECLRDLQWLSARGYVIQFKEADRFIEMCKSDFRILVQIIKSVSRHWKANNIEFILIVETNNPRDSNNHNP